MLQVNQFALYLPGTLPKQIFSLSFSVIWSVFSRDGEAVVVSYGVWFVILHLFGPGPDDAALAQADYSSGGCIRALCANHNSYVLVAPTTRA